MDNQSPFLAMQRAETHLKSLLRAIDTDLLDTDQKKVLASLRRLSSEARLDIRDYELSETRDEQLKKAVQAKKRLAKLQATILAIGMMFGPADVAQLDAQLAQIQDHLI
jgi:hypothetical protein